MVRRGFLVALLAPLAAGLAPRDSRLRFRADAFSLATRPLVIDDPLRPGEVPDPRETRHWLDACVRRTR